MHCEITTLPIHDSESDKDVSKLLMNIDSRDIAVTWRDIWQLIRGRKLHLRVILKWHPFGENTATAILRFTDDKMSGAPDKW